jgi:hypothetical protein
MKTTHYLSVLPHGHGHWLISTDHRNKNICCITTNSVAVGEYKSGESRAEINRGYKVLRSEIIRCNTIANW